MFPHKHGYVLNSYIQISKSNCLGGKMPLMSTISCVVWGESNAINLPFGMVYATLGSWFWRWLVALALPHYTHLQLAMNNKMWQDVAASPFKVVTRSKLYLRVWEKSKSRVQDGVGFPGIRLWKYISIWMMQIRSTDDAIWAMLGSWPRPFHITPRIGKQPRKSHRPSVFCAFLQEFPWFNPSLWWFNSQYVVLLVVSITCLFYCWWWWWWWWWWRRS